MKLDLLPNAIKQNLAQLIDRAIDLGATDAGIVSSRDICVDPGLAALCNGEYTCPDYGLGTSCPPHVKGPEEFRKWQERSQYAVVVKIELPARVMFSQDRKEVMRLLHQVVAGVETKAMDLGFGRSRAFAGGSCKSLFCEAHTNCCVISDNRPCRHQNTARPSMSGFGIDVIQMMHTAGWPVTATDPKAREDEKTSWVAGLVLLA